MITIPGGTYRIGSEEGYYDDEAPVHEVTLEAFAIGLFPVTNAEWALFMRAGGYDEARWWQGTEAQAWQRGEEMAGGVRQWWQEWRQSWQGQPRDAVREWLQTQPSWALEADDWEAFVYEDEAFERDMRHWYPPGRQTQPALWYDDAFNHPAQPVVGICWYEARAYCAWLSAQTGQTFRLPTEVEWEAAARGKRGWRYAYGQDFTVAQCNTFETHVRRTTPIGVFPGNTTPEGVQDLTGNVWEWTGSLYKPYPYKASDGREAVNATSAARRVRRGGSWLGGHRFARAAYRYRSAPGLRVNGSGLRLVRVVPFP